MKIKKFISWLLFILWLGVIFFFSSQSGSASSNLSNSILMLLPFKISSFAIRKLAHFTEYFILGLLGMNSINKSGAFRNKNIILLSLFILLYALSDEIHQYFVGGRAMRVLDVFIDYAGGLVSQVTFKLIKDKKKHTLL